MQTMAFSRKCKKKDNLSQLSTEFTEKLSVKKKHDFSGAKSNKNLESVFEQDQDGDTLFMYFIIYGETQKALQVISETKRRNLTDLLNLRNFDHHQTALHLAALTKQHEIMEALLEAGVEPANMDKRGFTPLQIVVKNDDMNGFEIIRKTVPKPIFQNMLKMKNYQGDASLHVAARHGCLSMIQRILDTSNIDINMKGNNNDTMLHVAVQQQDLCLMMLLVRNNLVDLEAKTLNGNTALDISIGNDYRMCKQLLLSAGAIIHEPVDNFDDDTD